MNILVVGNEDRMNALKSRLPSDASITHHNYPPGQYDDVDLVFDLNFDDDIERLSKYENYEGTLVAGAVKVQLAEAQLLYPESSCRLIGMNTLPTFLDREQAEWSLPSSTSNKEVENTASQLGWNYHLVKDRVGMATPRIIMMIINEACYTLQEGTASIEDIDRAMKLGTAYPYGPFEWAERIGIGEVYETLEALYHDTQDERYRICPLLKTLFLEAKTFYPT